jgi:hypothetical protein
MMIDLTDEQLNNVYYLGLAQHKETKLFHGVLYRKDFAPSGFERHFMQGQINVGKSTRKEATDLVNSVFSRLKPLELEDEL